MMIGRLVPAFLLFQESIALTGTRRERLVYVQDNDASAWAADNITALGSDFPANTGKQTLILGIGFPKCGSHHAWEVLSKHSQTVTGYEKELKYFAWPDFHKESGCKAPSGDWDPAGASPAAIYTKACFGTAGEDKQKSLLEFSPGYAPLRGTMIERTFGKLKAVWPELNVRMIALVRDPLQRATSEINMMRDYGTVNGTDEQLSDILHNQMLLAEGARAWDDPKGYQVYAGEYVDSLKMWLDHFPKESLLIVNNAALNDVVAWKRMFAHVGLGEPSDEWIEWAMKNSYGNNRKNREQATYMNLAENVKQELQKHYADHDQRLFEFLGVDPWW